ARYRECEHGKRPPSTGDSDSCASHRACGNVMGARHPMSRRASAHEKPSEANHRSDVYGKGRPDATTRIGRRGGPPVQETGSGILNRRGAAVKVPTVLDGLLLGG